MRRGVFIVVSLVCITGCKDINPDYCGRPENMHRPECMEPTTGGPCQNRDDCVSATPDRPVCDTSTGDGVCVQCTADDHALCKDRTPRCENRICVACVDDGDCGDKGVCLQDGSCADPSRIIHAKATGGFDNETCGAIGNECSLPRALTVVTADKDIIKLDDATTYTSSFELRIDTIIPVTIAARGAILSRSTDNEILRIEPSVVVTLLGGTISNARNFGGHGVACKAGSTVTLRETTIKDNGGSAIDADECTLTISKAIISNNSLSVSRPAIDVSGGSLTLSRTKLSANKGGGVRVINNGAFTIVGNLFHDNGTLTSSVGGLFLNNTTASMKRIEFNTLVDNKNAPQSAQGIFCNTESLTARNNIVWTTVVTADPMITGLCKHNYSNIWQPVPSPFSGQGNINADPLFESPSDFRVRSGSPVDGEADPATDVSGIAEFDLEGRKRPMGQADIGAYEVPPQ